MSRPRPYTILLGAFVALAIAALGGSVLAAPAGSAFTYQGQLASSGAPVTATCDFAFTLYDDATAGVQVGSTILQTLSVVDGLFVTPLDFGSVWEGSARWLEIAVVCPTGGVLNTLSPRQPLTPTPYAVWSGTASAAPWSGLSGIPAGFADGVDDAGPTYSAGSNVAITGTVISVPAFPWASLTGVPAGFADGTDDTGPTYSAGSGIDLTGNAITVITSTIQQRVSGSCSVGQYVRAVAADGSVTCGTDSTGTSNPGTITGVTAGTGLTGGGITGTVVISANTSVLQARVSGTCTAGQWITSIAADGTPTCGGVTLDQVGNPAANTTFNLANKDIHWVFSNPAGGMHFDWQGAASGHLMEIMTTNGNAQAGTHLLHIESDTTAAMPLHLKTVAGGQALKVEGTSVISGAVAITGTLTTSGAITAGGTISATNYPPSACPANSYIRQVLSNGTVVCGADNLAALICAPTQTLAYLQTTPGNYSWQCVDRITSVAAGSGLSGGGASGAITLTVPTAGITATHVLSTQVQLRVTGTCSAGQVMTGVQASGAVTCTTDLNSGGTITGTGAAGRVAYWDGSGSITGSSSITAISGVTLTAGAVGAGVSSPVAPLDVKYTGGIFAHIGDWSNGWALGETSDAYLHIYQTQSGIATSQKRVTVDYFGNVGISSASPAGRIDVRGATNGGMLFWDGTSITTAQTILTGITRSVFGTYACYQSTGTANTSQGNFSTWVNSSTTVNCGSSHTVTFAISAGGTMTVARATGTNPLTVVVQFIWQ